MSRGLRIFRSIIARKKRTKVKELKNHRISLLFSKYRRLRKQKKKRGSVPSKN
jgi:hypothetical protein